MATSDIRLDAPNVDFHGGRVLLPRHDRPRLAPASGRKRAKKACTSCRIRKTKCTAEAPRCADCVANDLDCVYENNKKDRLSEISSQRQLLVDLVLQLRLSATQHDRQQMEDALDKVDEVYAPLPPQSFQDTGQAYSDTSDTSSHTVSALPNDSAADDVNIIDFWAATYDSSSIVFAQTDSGAQWTPNLHGDFTGPNDISEDTAFTYPPQTNTYAPNYDLHQHLEINHLALPFDIPPYATALRLIPHYTRTVHDWLPIVPADFLGRDIRLYYEAPMQVNNKRLAMLHLVLAIGARHAYLTDRTGTREQNREDVQHFSRAVGILGLSESAVVMGASDMGLVQCYGLLSVYYLGVGQVERAWLTTGIALRHAIALNLHLKSPPNTPWPSKSASDARTWWSLRTFESLLCSITHRPSSFPLNDCNVPLPTSSTDDATTHSLQIYTKITIITQWALSALYTVKAATLPWPSILDRVGRLKSELESLLPQIADQQRLMLHFAWFDAMMIVTRPCLGLGRQDDASRDLAGQCVHAARGVARLLPGEPRERIWANGPWWCLAHYIIRALGVFALAGGEEEGVGKLVSWLEWMAPDDVVAVEALRKYRNSDGQRDLDMGSYGGYPFLEDRWNEDPGQPQFLQDFHSLDDLLDSDGVIGAMVSQSRPDMLPMPLI